MSSDGQEAEVQIPIPELLEAMLERGASDLHITVGTPPTIRQYGDLVRLDEYPVLDARGIQGMIYAILPQKMRERLEQGRSEERRVGKECVRLCRSRWSPYH